MKQAITYLKILFAVTAWGASFVATKIALDTTSPSMVVWLRFAIGIIILGVFVFFRKQFLWPSRKDLAYFALLGLIGITFHQWLQSNGLVTAQATTTAWIVATTPIFIALLGLLVLHEKMRWDAVLGIIAAAFGVLMVVTKGDWRSLLLGQFGTPGDLLIMISAPNWAVFSVLSRKGLQKHNAAPMTLYVMIFGWVGTTVTLFCDSGFGEIRTLSQDGWWAMCFLGFVATGLAYAFWYDGLEKISASRVGVFLYLEPVVTMLIANSLLGEPFLVITLIGGITILIGVWLVNHPRSENYPEESITP